MMKKFSLLVFMLFVGISTSIAQTDPILNLSKQKEHLKFKGIEITGTLENMINVLQESGYILTEKSENSVLLKGTFANEDCELLVSATPKTKCVYQILVALEKEDSWYSLKSDYTKFKEQLREKYNVRPNTTERFLDPYYEGDGYELQALRLNKCLYKSNFKLDNGEISVVILSNRLAIVYADKEGQENNEREENQNAYDDL